MKIHVETLFIKDQDNRIIALNCSDGRPPPRFFLGRTREGNVWRFRHNVPEKTLLELEEVAASEPVSSTLSGNPVNFHKYQRILEKVKRVQSIWTGPAYRFPRRTLPHESEAILIKKTDSHYLEKGFADSIADLETSEPLTALIRDGIAVSICCSARATEKAAEAGVATMGYYRGKGYALEVVSTWANIISQSGRIPLYSTSWSNKASLKVAMKLHLVQYGAVVHFT